MIRIYISLLIFLFSFSFFSNPVYAVNLTVNGGTRLQTIDGFGASAVPFYWNNGALKPAFDTLIDELGATIFRLDLWGTSDWEDPNDNNDPLSFNWTYYNNLYGQPKFKDVWNTSRYIESKGAQVILWAEGQLSGWLGWTSLSQANEEEWVEMIVSMACYAKNKCGATNPLPLQNFMLSPINETDIGGGEGPSVDAVQFARIMNKLSQRLDALGLSDVKLVLPDLAYIENQTQYLTEMFKYPFLMSKIAHYSFHDYDGGTGATPYNMVKQYNIDNNTNITPWMAEWSQMTTDGNLDGGQQVANEWDFAKVMTDYLFNHLAEGASAALAWDAYDSSWDPTRDSRIFHWGFLTTNYTPKKRYFTNAHFYKFVKPGAVRVGVTNSLTGVKILAFHHPITNQVIIVGYNNTASAKTVDASLTNIPVVNSLQFYQTTSSTNLVQQSDVIVTNNVFSTTVAANSFFTLTNTPVPLSPTSSFTPTPTPKKLGDVDGNGIVDIFDFNEVIGFFGRQQTNPYLDADLDRNGKVDIFDFNEVVANFGR